jgi:hypothetical protein
VTFLRVLHAEWTKFRTVRGWVTGTVAAALMVVLVAILAGFSSNEQGSPPVPIGPGGEPVTDSVFLVHRPLTGDGGITVSVAALTSSPGPVPWAKAGLIIRESTRPGAPYAAIMVTGGHGVRMQSNYVNDTAGTAGTAGPAAPARWLRLDRSGEEITGSASADGTQWTEVGTVRLGGLGPAALGGLFVASPSILEGFGTRGTVSTAEFDDLPAGGGWVGEQLGPGYTPGSFTESGGRLTVTGSGDIAPAVRETLPTAGALGEILTGTFAALIAVVVVGALFITAEYRDNLIRVTLAASPGRGRVLVAKAIVLGAVTFVAGLAGAGVAIPLGRRIARAHGVYLFPVTAATELRVALGVAAMLAAGSILALSVGAILRHGAGAVATVVVAVVLPYLVIANPFTPAGVSDWVARVTPAATFAVQQTLVRYHQVETIYTPYDGYFPLAPWAGLAVLAGYAALSLAAAALLLRRRDA